MGMIHEGGPHITDERITEILLLKDPMKVVQLFSYVNDCDDCWKKLVEVKKRRIKDCKAELKDIWQRVIGFILISLVPIILLGMSIKTNYLKWTMPLILFLVILVMVIKSFNEVISPTKKWLQILESIPEPEKIENDPKFVSVACHNYRPPTKQ